jgi:hypothetical protein
VAALMAVLLTFALSLDAIVCFAYYLKRQRQCEMTLCGTIMLSIYKGQHGNPISQRSRSYSPYSKAQPRSGESATLGTPKLPWSAGPYLWLGIASTHTVSGQSLYQIE